MIHVKREVIMVRSDEREMLLLCRYCTLMLTCGLALFYVGMICSGATGLGH